MSQFTDTYMWYQPSINSLRPRQNGRHFPDDNFKRIFLYENVRISIKISMMFVPKAPINNCPPLVQMMAWRRPGDNPLSEPMMVRLLTHICVTRPQWVKDIVLETLCWSHVLGIECIKFIILWQELNILLRHGSDVTWTLKSAQIADNLTVCWRACSG